ncbi:hypothetical protein ACIP6P_00580 [Streptomyces sp. NPDC088729]|uniref:hypothetical protein n=1 Tax=Streptomyces sp. NPDC088729 TaxID=3365876 RepID=UPI0037F74726
MMSTQDTDDEGVAGMKHTVKVAKVGEVRVRKADEGSYLIFEVDITSEGRVTQVLQIPHHMASGLQSSIADQAFTIPVDQRRTSFQESLRRATS